MVDQSFIPALPVPTASTDVVGVGFAVPAGGSAATILTFGQPFRAGDVPAGTSLALRLSNGQDVPVQLDVSTRHADGSAKFGTVTARLPALAAGEVTGMLHLAAASTSPALDLASLLAKHSVAVAVSPIGAGRGWSGDLAALLAASLRQGAATAWTSGPLASQARISLDVPPAAVGGATSMRLVADLAVRADGTLSADVWLRNDKAMDAGGGTARYSVTVALDGKQALKANNVTQAQYQDWGRWLDTGPATAPTVQNDPAYLARTGAIAHYDTTTGVARTLLASYGAAVSSNDWQTVLGSRGITQYMPGTGGRADIGPTTQAQAAWLLTGDADAAAYAIGQAEAGGAIPWNLWDKAAASADGADTWLRVTDWPKLWSDARGGTPPTGLAQQIPTTTGWTLDSAHQPDLDYTPYLLTGRRAFLDQVESQASWNIAAEWPYARLDAQGILANGNQVRGAAWALRQVDEAAWAAPDGSPEAAYFRAVSNSNWAWLVSKLPEWTRAEGEAYGYIPGDYGVPGALPPWQQDYFATTAAAAARNGNQDAKAVLAWEANFLVGRFTHAAQGFDPHDGVAYLLDIGMGTGTQTTWAGIAAATKAHGDSNNGGWATSQGDYAQLALGSLASLADVLDLQPARDAYAWLKNAGAPFTTASDYAGNPTFDITPTAAATVPASPGTLVLTLSEDAWQGDAQFQVTLDGKQLGQVQTVSASHAAGASQAFTFTGLADTTHTVGVTFLNDAWGGGAGMDRNLYVNGVAFDGVAVPNGSAALLGNGLAQFTVGPKQAGTSTLALNVSEDAWQGDAQFTVRVDGQQVGTTWTATASHAAGKTQAVMLGSQFTPGTHDVAVTFLNDAWGGTAAADRNLYVDGITVDGIKASNSTAALLNAGTAELHVTAGTPANNALVLNVSEDAWQGNAQFTVSVDGQQGGGTWSATASHAAGQTQQIILPGQFGSGAHDIAVTFINDAWGGSAATDRNLYVNSVDYGSQHFGGLTASLLSNGTVHLSLPALTP